MVDAEERGYDETQPQEKGSRLKNARTYTLREQQSIARFGKSVLHPLCQAALQHWQIETEHSALMNKALEAKKLRDDFKEQRRKAVALVDWFSDRKRKEVAEAAAVLKKIDKEFLPKAQELYEANLEFMSLHNWDLNRAVASVLFEHERDKYKGDNQAQKALQRTQKRWDDVTNGKPLKPSDARKLGILRILHDKKVKGTWAIAGPAAGYWEIATGGGRPLSDETWQGRLTAREIHDGLKSIRADLAGDKDAKELRRDAKKLGIQLAEDERGRKLRGPFSKSAISQKPKKPRGRPREKVDWFTVGGTNKLEAIEAKAADSLFAKTYGSQTPKGEPSYGWHEKNRLELKWCRKVLKQIAAEIRKLTLLRGGRRGNYVY